MKILLYEISFAPEPTGIGKYTGELDTSRSENFLCLAAFIG